MRRWNVDRGTCAEERGKRRRTEEEPRRKRPRPPSAFLVAPGRRPRDREAPSSGTRRSGSARKRHRRRRRCDEDEATERSNRVRRDRPPCYQESMNRVDASSQTRRAFYRSREEGKRRGTNGQAEERTPTMLEREQRGASWKDEDERPRERARRRLPVDLKRNREELRAWKQQVAGDTATPSRGCDPRRNSTLIGTRYTRRDTSNEISKHPSDPRDSAELPDYRVTRDQRDRPGRPFAELRWYVYPG